MLKNIMNLHGIQQLRKSEQTVLNGGGFINKCSRNGVCLVFDNSCYEIECHLWNEA